MDIGFFIVFWVWYLNEWARFHWYDVGITIGKSFFDDQASDKRGLVNLHCVYNNISLDLPPNDRFYLLEVLCVILFCWRLFQRIEGFHCTRCQEEVVDIHADNTDLTFWALNQDAGILVELPKTDAFVESYDVLVPKSFGLLQSVQASQQLTQQAFSYLTEIIHPRW